MVRLKYVHYGFFILLMKTEQKDAIAYLRVSTDRQDVERQKMVILEYANRHGIHVRKFVEVKLSTRKKAQQQGFTAFLDELLPGEIGIITDLSRMGRSLIDIINQVNFIVKENINFIAIANNIVILSDQETLDMETKMKLYTFGMMAEIQRDIISRDTKDRLAVAKKNGKILGRPKGKIGKSKLDGEEKHIASMLDKKMSKASIARYFEVSRPTLDNFIKTRKLEAGGLLKEIQ